MGFFLEVLIGGLLAGGLYSLVALGFVLIFKGSGGFNFAPGGMVLSAAPALVRAPAVFEQWHWPFGVARAAAPSRTPTPRRNPSASRSTRSGSSSGWSPAWWRWWRARCGAASSGSSFRSHYSR